VLTIIYVVKERIQSRLVVRADSLAELDQKTLTLLDVQHEGIV